MSKCILCGDAEALDITPERILNLMNDVPKAREVATARGICAECKALPYDKCYIVGERAISPICL